MAFAKDAAATNKANASHLALLKKDRDIAQAQRDNFRKAVQKGIEDAPVERKPVKRPNEKILSRIDKLKNWRKKMDICKACEVLQSLYASDIKPKS